MVATICRSGGDLWPPVAERPRAVLPGDMSNARRGQSPPPDASKPDELAPDSPITPVRTAPLVEEQRGVWHDGPDIVTWLRKYDVAGAVDWHLPRDVYKITIGASAKKCDIVIPGLSQIHGLLERRQDRLRLIDQSSTNGTYFQDRRVSDVWISPGDTFTLAPVTLLAMNDDMAKHRPTFVDVLGMGSTPSPDKLLVEAARGSANLLLWGEPTCDQEQLARAIHAVSLRSRRPAIELAAVPDERARQRAIIDSAARSTLILSLFTEGQRRLDATFCSMVCTPTYHVRVIVLAPDVDTARELMPQDTVDQMQHIWVRPLAVRSDEIDRLLDGLFEKLQSPLRTADLTAENRAALRAHDWPKNFAELRQVAEGIVAHVTLGGLRPAAKSLGLGGKSALQHVFDRVGLTIPLLAGPAAPR